MKNWFFPLLILSLCFSFTVLENDRLNGVWAGEVRGGDHPGSFTLKLHKNGKFVLAMNKKEMSDLKGSWSLNGDVLSFKGSDEELQAKRIKGKKHLKPGEGKFIHFKRKKRTTSFKLSGGSFKVFGFGDTVDALVIAPELASP
ncbi:MAG: hypothetical protein AAF502_17480 [Bacteroidota bacterium]